MINDSGMERGVKGSGGGAEESKQGFDAMRPQTALSDETKSSFLLQSRSGWRRLTKGLAWLLMTITPVLGTLVLMELLGVSLSDFAPVSSDEIGYYLQVNAFVHHGFSGGYFTICEHPAWASFSHFGVHGPMFPVLYGAFGKLFGWHFYSGPLFNMALVTLAIGVYCMVSQPTAWQAILGTAFFATFWPFHMMLVSLMQDPVHFAIAILIATGFSGMLRGKPWARTRTFRGWFLALLIYASLMRISWAMFLVPYAMLVVQKPAPHKLALAALTALVGIGILLYSFRLLCAPFVGAPRAFLMNKLAGGEVSAGAVMEHLFRNLALLFGRELWKETDVPGAIVLWQAIVFGCMVGLYAVTSLFDRRPGHDRMYPRPVVVECWFHAFNIWGLFVGIILFYLVDNSGGWRMMAIPVLISSLIAITSTSTWPRITVVFIVLLSAGALEWARQPVRVMNLPRFTYSQIVRQAATPIERLITYREGADPWLNTVLTDRYPIELLSLPAGIGVSFNGDTSDGLMLPIRSRYVLAEEKAAKVQKRTSDRLVHFPLLHDSIQTGQTFSANLYLLQPQAPKATAVPGGFVRGDFQKPVLDLPAARPCPLSALVGSYTFGGVTSISSRLRIDAGLRPGMELFVDLPGSPSPVEMVVVEVSEKNCVARVKRPEFPEHTLRANSSAHSQFTSDPRDGE